MALSKTGQRKSQEKGKACFNVGLNFPEKHAMHFKSYLQCIILFSTEIFLLFVFFLILSIKVKTLEMLSTLTDRLTDRQKNRCFILFPQPMVLNRHFQIGQQTKTLQDFFFVVVVLLFNTSSMNAVLPDKYHLEDMTTSRKERKIMISSSFFLI